MSEHDVDDIPTKDEIELYSPQQKEEAGIEEVRLGSSIHGLSGSAQTVRKKRRYLNCLVRSLGVIQTACEKAHIGRSTVQAWRTNDRLFAEAFILVDEIKVDYAESKLFKRMDVCTRAIDIFLKAKAKKRGYCNEQVIVNRNFDSGRDPSTMTDEDLEEQIRVRKSETEAESEAETS